MPVIPDDAEIVAAFPRAPSAMRVSELGRRLGLGRALRQLLRERVRDLSASGALERHRGSRYSRPGETVSATGVLLLNPRGFGFVATQGAEEDIYVHARCVGNALHRDWVRVRLKHGPRGRVEGVVTEVLERGARTFVAVYRDDGRRDDGRQDGDHGWRFLLPQDPRLPPEIALDGPPEAARDGDLVACAFTRYPDDLGRAAGRILRVLGAAGEQVRETDRVVYELGLPIEFPAPVEAAAEAVDGTISTEEVGRRHDLRSRALFTIDPETARDFDDAVHAEPLPAGGWRLTVAIADVAHYVRHGDPLDAEARQRNTSVYLPDRVIPMLPERLSSDLCSLRPGTDRLTMVVEVEVGVDGALGRFDLFEAVIHSRGRLSYNRVARMMGLRSAGDATEIDARPEIEALRPVLEALLHCTRALRGRRRRRGYLDVELPEARILLDDEGQVSRVEALERHEAHLMIEEAMIVANEVAARHFTNQGRRALFRVHEEPTPDRIESFCRKAQALGAPYSGGMRLRRLSAYLREQRGHRCAELLHLLALRSMAKAEYRAENGLHFGLGTRHYLHFTSPIRRYPDLVVHRMIKADLHGQRLQAAYSDEALPSLAAYCGRRERLADDAERAVLDLYRALYLKRHLMGVDLAGMVYGITGLGLFVRLEGHWAEGLLHADRLEPPDLYEVEAGTGDLVGRHHGTRYRLGDPLRVRVAQVDLQRRRVNLELAPGGFST